MKYDEFRIEISTDASTWTDISAYVDDGSVISFSRGIQGNSVVDRTAQPGTISFTVLDRTGAFDPINTSAIISAGTHLRVVQVFEGIERVQWYGRVRGITPRQDVLYRNRAQVTGVCKLEELNRPLLTPLITTNKTADEVVDEILDDLNITLTETQKQYGTMTQTFPSVFDTARSKQNALGEISKAILSELGYFYLRGSRSLDDGFAVTVDGRNTREGRSYINIPAGKDQSGFLLKEDGDFLLKEDGGKIILNQAQQFTGFSEFGTVSLSYGKNIVNECIVTVYPRTYSEVATVLFSLASTPGIDAGETLEMTARYADPTQEAQSITARSTITPVAVTDYTANAERDGSGADMTASLSVTANFTASEIKYTLINTHSTDTLYITKLQARGEGIFFYGSVNLIASDSASQSANGYKPLTINLKYLDDVATGQAIASAVVASAKDIFQEVDWFEINANASSQNLYACMFLDIGDPILIPVLDASGAAATVKSYINAVSWSGNRGNWNVRYTCASQEVTEI